MRRTQSQIKSGAPSLNVLTFDIEDWFHILNNEETRSEEHWNRYPTRIEQNVDRILDVLDRKDQKATCFCLGWVARKYPYLIRRIADRGHEIACHSHMHQLVHQHGVSAFRQDLQMALRALQDATGRKITAYRAPGFSVTHRDAAWFFEILGEEGIEVDCSIFAARHGHGGLPDFPLEEPCKVRWSGGTIMEFPMVAVSIFGVRIPVSGGGYFRLAPYPAIRYLAQRQPYLMTYFHPRDFDPHQPMVPGLSFVRQFKSYCGLASSMKKLERFLTDFRFFDVHTAVMSVNWAAAKEIQFSRVEP